MIVTPKQIGHAHHGAPEIGRHTGSDLATWSSSRGTIQLNFTARNIVKNDAMPAIRPPERAVGVILA